MINAEIQKSGTENALATIRKFTRRVQGTGIIKQVRAIRYRSRLRSKAVTKKSALKMLARKAHFRQMVKEGKVAEKTPRMTTPQRDMTKETPTQSRFGETTPIAR